MKKFIKVLLCVVCVAAAVFAALQLLGGCGEKQAADEGEE